jgi:hypothetical protein
MEHIDALNGSRIAFADSLSVISKDSLEQSTTGDKSKGVRHLASLEQEPHRKNL